MGNKKQAGRHRRRQVQACAGITPEAVVGRRALALLQVLSVAHDHVVTGLRTHLRAWPCVCVYRGGWLPSLLRGGEGGHPMCERRHAQRSLGLGTHLRSAVFQEEHPQERQRRQLLGKWSVQPAVVHAELAERRQVGQGCQATQALGRRACESSPPAGGAGEGLVGGRRADGGAPRCATAARGWCERPLPQLATVVGACGRRRDSSPQSRSRSSGQERASPRAPDSCSRRMCGSAPSARVGGDSSGCLREKATSIAGSCVVERGGAVVASGSPVA